MIDQVRAHVADGADAPVHPAAPVERVIDRVIFDALRDAEEEIPVERSRLRIVAGHRRREPRFDARTVPGEAIRRRRPHFRTRKALRPVAERTIRPDVDFADVADRAGHHVLDGGSSFVGRMTLIAHLRGEFRLPCATRELPRFAHRPAERLLHVDVLAEIHRRERDRRVHVVRRRDDDRVDVLLLVEHLPIVDVSLRAGQMLILQARHARDLDRRPLALDGGERRNRPALRVEPRRVRRPVQALLLVFDVRRERVEALVRVLPVHVAQRDDVLAGHVDQVAAALTADADGGDVEQIARRRHAASEDVARHDGETG